MKKYFVSILLLCILLPMTTALGDRWDLIFSDGTTTINGTDVCLDDGKCLSATGTASGDIEAVNTIGNYITGGGTTGSVDIDLNETYLNETITTIATAIGGSGDNESWNETYANTLYISTSDEGNLNVNSSDYWDNYNTANTTWFENIAGVLSLKLSELASYLDTWLGTKDTDDLTEGSTNLYDNQSWTEAVADAKYALIGAGADNSSWNESYADTLYADISITGDNSTWNESYANTLYSNYSDADIGGDETAFDGWDKDASNDFDGSWNSLTDVPSGFADGVDNQSTGGADWTEITSIPAGFDDDVDNDTTYSALSEFNNDVGFWNDTFATFNKTYADTLYASISVTGDNSSWNESYANTLYAVIGYGDDWNKTYADTLYADIGVTGDNSSWNESYANTLYYDISNPSTFWNATFALFNKTYADTLYADISITGDNSSWNESYADTLYASISVTGDNESWNETYANTLYAPLNYGDDWNKTYADTLYADISVVDTNVLTDASFNETQMENSEGVLNILESWLTTFFNSLFAGKTTDDLTQGSTNLYDNSSWNQTLADSLYAPISVTGDNESWNETYANTLFAPINYGDDWNKTYADTLYADIGVTGDNSSWNESYADTLYYGIDNPSSFWNDTYATFNKTYADTLYADISVVDTDTNLTEDDVESYIFDNDNTANLNMSTYNITRTAGSYDCYNQACTSYIYHNGTGLIIQA